MQPATHQAHQSTQMTEPFHPVASAGQCRDCGSQMALDQRYCIACGGKTAKSRVPFDEALGETPSAVPLAPAAAQGAGTITPALAAAMVCLAVLFLGTGVLVGRSGSDTKPVAQSAPQVLTVPAGGATADGSAAAAGAQAPAGSAAKTGGAAAKTYVAPKVSAKVAGDSQKMLACSKQKELSDSCKKLAAKVKTVVTPGAPPPTDNKAPAGGAQGQTFN